MLYAGFESMSKYIIERKNKLLEKENNRYELNM